ncbi:UxaA family hydrolase [Gordonia sp. NPDC003424]
MPSDILQLRDGDDVAIALHPLPVGTRLGDVATTGDVPGGHKIALHDLAEGSLVHKYGHVIGVASAAIRAGDHVHTHNMTMPENPTGLATADPSDATAADRPTVPADLPRTFDGIVRPDGRVATRNYVAVLSTVNCSATVVKQIVRRTEDEIAELHVDGVDGVVALAHGTGCGMADSGLGWDVLRRTLIGYAQHPNIGALVVVGLGCEVNAMRSLVEDMTLPEWLPHTSFTIQEVGGTAAAISEGVVRVRAMADRLRGTRRQPVPVRHLTLGMQCGGSDAWSALTANPALGVASDHLVALGATSLLGETPEIYGAEQMLAGRAADPAVRDKLIERIEWWERYTSAQGASLDGNPSPGNKAGGITTILEKSLGSVAKGGRSPLAEVVDYAAAPTRDGLVFMDTPGYDPVSATGMVAGGANIIAFTTGRGSAFGSRPAPTIKLATNSELATRMAGDIDVDCSGVVESGVSVAEMGSRIYRTLIDVASGRRSASEELGVGGEEIVPWQIGAVL